MRVINKNKDAVISEDAKLVRSVFGKAFGLMFRKEPKPLVFEFRVSRKVGLHMFFVFCTIDVIFLDEDLNVVDLKEGFEPWATYKPGEKCNYVIEVPAGIISDTGTELDDKIALESKDI